MKVLFVTLFIVLADQISKVLVKGCSIPSLGISIRGMKLGESAPVIGDSFRITFIENPGMAMGIDLGGKLYFSIFSVIASIGIFYYLYLMRRERLLFRFSLATILGGAIGNLIDRVFYGVFYSEAPLFYGKVVDFFDVDIIDINILGFQLSRFFIFNIADAAVSVGVVIVILFGSQFNKTNKESPSAAAEPSGPADTTDQI